MASGETVLVRAASDLHGQLPEIEPCDVLLLAGDRPLYEIEEDQTACEQWRASVFADWLALDVLQRPSATDGCVRSAFSIRQISDLLAG